MTRTKKGVNVSSCRFERNNRGIKSSNGYNRNICQNMESNKEPFQLLVGPWVRTLCLSSTPSERDNETPVAGNRNPYSDLASVKRDHTLRFGIHRQRFLFIIILRFRNPFGLFSKQITFVIIPSKFQLLQWLSVNGRLLRFTNWTFLYIQTY